MKTFFCCKLLYSSITALTQSSASLWAIASQFYLLSVFCVLDFSHAGPLCQSYRGKVLRLRILVFVPGSWLEAPEWATGGIFQIKQVLSRGNLLGFYIWVWLVPQTPLLSK